MSDLLPLTLLPLNAAEHVSLLQAVYDAVPRYWAHYDLPAAPPKQAGHDLLEAAEVPGRTLLGILLPIDRADESAGPTVEMIGLVDVRLHFPAEHVASVGMLMVAEPYQRLGIGRAAWEVLEPWLHDAVGMTSVRLSVEQFNPEALRFFTSLGFALTGEAHRTQVGDRFIRLLFMEKDLDGSAA